MDFRERLEELKESRGYNANDVAEIAEEMIDFVGAHEILAEALHILSSDEKIDLLIDVAKNLDIKWGDRW